MSTIAPVSSSPLRSSQTAASGWNREQTGKALSIIKSLGEPVMGADGKLTARVLPFHAGKVPFWARSVRSVLAPNGTRQVEVVVKAVPKQILGIESGLKAALTKQGLPHAAANVKVIQAPEKHATFKDIELAGQHLETFWKKTLETAPQNHPFRSVHSLGGSVSFHSDNGVMVRIDATKPNAHLVLNQLRAALPENFKHVDVFLSVIAR